MFTDSRLYNAFSVDTRSNSDTSAFGASAVRFLTMPERVVIDFQIGSETAEYGECLRIPDSITLD